MSTASIHKHLHAACAGVLLGCMSGGLVAVLFPGGDLHADIVLMLINGAVVGVVALAVSIIEARRPPP